MSTAIPDIGKSAKQALEKSGITSLEQLTKIDEKSLLTLVEIGPKIIEKLKAAMKDTKLSLLQEPFHSFSTDFLVFGDLKCDNAPKKRVIRDYLILSGMQDREHLLEFVSEDITVKIILFGTI